MKTNLLGNISAGLLAMLAVACGGAGGSFEGTGGFDGTGGVGGVGGGNEEPPPIAPFDNF